MHWTDKYLVWIFNVVMTLCCVVAGGMLGGVISGPLDLLLGVFGYHLIIWGWLGIIGSLALVGLTVWPITLLSNREAERRDRFAVRRLTESHTELMLEQMRLERHANGGKPITAPRN